MEKPSEGYVRLVVNIPTEAAEALRGMSSRRGLTVTELVRRAIGCLKFFDEAKESGKTIELRKGSKIQRIEIFF